jgi:hypothetical protein
LPQRPLGHGEQSSGARARGDPRVSCARRGGRRL